MKNKNLKKEYRFSYHSGHKRGVYKNFPKIRSDYSKSYFRELGKKEILDQLRDCVVAQW